jgi:hypothetical protein
MGVNGESKIVAEQRVVDDGGILVMDEIPPILPVDLCGMIAKSEGPSLGKGFRG